MCPSPSSDGDVDNENEESTEFTEAHVNYFQETFVLYGIDYNIWVLCQCPDSAAVNIKISMKTHC